MVWIALSPRQWEDRLHDLCLNGEDQRLVIDLVRWLKIGVSERKPMQVFVIRNLVSKLTMSTWLKTEEVFSKSSLDLLIMPFSLICLV